LGLGTGQLALGLLPLLTQALIPEMHPASAQRKTPRTLTKAPGGHNG
jgi:hypothetical protein